MGVVGGHGSTGRLTFQDFSLPYELLDTRPVVSRPGVGVSRFHGVFQMGTQRIPESNPEEALEVKDIPRIGWSLWLLLAGFMFPPILVTVVGNAVGGIPLQTTWVALLSCPIPVILLTLPRSYTIGPEHLVVRGLFYRLRIPLTAIRSVRPVSGGRALVHLGSVFCSDPGRALLVERDGGFSLIISPKNAGPFLRLDPSNQAGQD